MSTHPTGEPALETVAATVDRRAQAIYVHLDAAAMVATTRELSDTVNGDYDKVGNLVGVEVLGINIPAEQAVRTIVAAALVPQGAPPEAFWDAEKAGTRTYHPLAGDKAATVRHPGTLTRCLDPVCMAAAANLVPVGQDTKDVDYRTAVEHDLYAAGQPLPGPLDQVHVPVPEAVDAVMRVRDAELARVVAERDDLRRQMAEIRAALRVDGSWNPVHVVEQWAAEIPRLIAERDSVRAEIAACHEFQNGIGAILGVDHDWDAESRHALLDAVDGVLAERNQALVQRDEARRNDGNGIQRNVEAAAAFLASRDRWPENWRQQVGACTSSGAAVDLIDGWLGGAGEEGSR